MSRHVVVISFDQWHLGYLGCYGNDWVETPQWDGMAVGGVLFDHCYGENFDPQAVNHAWWTGRYQSGLTAAEQRAEPALADILRDAGVATRLVLETDDSPQIAPVFDEIHSVPGQPTEAVTTDAEAPWAQLVQRAIRVLELHDRQEKRSTVWWIKARGISAPWLPPQEYADLYYAEFGLDETPSEPAEEAEDSAYDPAVLARESVVLPQELLDLQYTRAFYAACATHRDRWLGKLLEQIRHTLPPEETLLLLTAASGDHVGERGVPGVQDVRLYEELIHVPLIVGLPSVPETSAAGTRRADFVQSVDLAPTICDWLQIPAKLRTHFHGRSLLPVLLENGTTGRPRILVQGAEGERGLRTANYYLRETPAAQPGAEAGLELFRKPHDRWDQADIARQAPGIVEELHAELRAAWDSRNPSAES